MMLIKPIKFEGDRLKNIGGYQILSPANGWKMFFIMSIYGNIAYKWQLQNFVPQKLENRQENPYYMLNIIAFRSSIPNLREIGENIKKFWHFLTKSLKCNQIRRFKGP